MTAPIKPPFTLGDLLLMLRRQGHAVSTIAALPGSRKLVRWDGDYKYVAVLPDIKDSTRLAAQTGSSICRQLNLDPADFGYRRGR